MQAKLKRLNIEIPEKDLQKLKIHAIKKGMTLKQYVMQSLVVVIIRDEQEEDIR